MKTAKATLLVLSIAACAGNAMALGPAASALYGDSSAASAEVAVPVPGRAAVYFPEEEERTVDKSGFGDKDSLRSAILSSRSCKKGAGYGVSCVNGVISRIMAALPGWVRPYAPPYINSIKSCRKISADMYDGACVEAGARAILSAID